MSTGTRNVIARVRRDGRWWYIELPELGTSGQARRLTEVEAVTREIAALWLDLDESAIEAVVTVELPPRAAELWAKANVADARAREDAQAAAQLRRGAVAALRDEGISQAEAARVLGVSEQRVSQLARV